MSSLRVCLALLGVSWWCPCVGRCVLGVSSLRVCLALLGRCVLLESVFCLAREVCPGGVCPGGVLLVVCVCVCV